MAKYSAIKAAVNAYIKANGRKEITGSILNAVLNATIDSLGKYFQFAGVATPTTNPENPDQNVCYLAGEPGTYTNFDNIVLENEEIALLFFDGTWSKQRMLLGIQEVIATVDDTVGTPSVDVDYSEGQLELDFHNIKGDKGNTGDAAGFGTIGATIDGNIGTPGVSVQESGPATAKNLVFNFTNLKGETGVTSVVATIDNGVGTPTCEVSLVGQQLTLAFHNLKGEQGNTGSSVDYPFEIVNNLTTNDSTKALSAAQGVALKGEVDQLEAKVTMFAPHPSVDYTDDVLELWLIKIPGNDVQLQSYNGNAYLLFPGTSILSQAPNVTKNNVPYPVKVYAGATAEFPNNTIVGYIMFHDVTSFRSKSGGNKQYLNTAYCSEIANAPITQLVLGQITVESSKTAVNAQNATRAGVATNTTNATNVVDAENTYSAFLKELYLFGTGVDTAKAYSVNAIARNHSTYKWSIIIKQESTIVCYLLSNPTEPENPVLVPEYGNSGVKAYAVVNWDAVEDGSNQSVNIPLLARVFDLNYSPTIRNYLRIKDVEDDIDDIGNDLADVRDDISGVQGEITELQFEMGYVIEATYDKIEYNRGDFKAGYVNTYSSSIGSVAALPTDDTPVTPESAAGHITLQVKRGDYVKAKFKAISNNVCRAWVYLDSTKKIISWSNPVTNTDPQETLDYLTEPFLFRADQDGYLVVQFPKASYSDNANSLISHLYPKNEEVITDYVEVCVPDTIYAVVGDTLQLYYRSIFRCVDYSKYAVKIVCNIGHQYPRYYEVTPSSGNVGTHTIEFTVKDNNNHILGTKTAELVVVPAGTNPASELNVLCLGASATQQGQWASELKRRLVGTGGTPAGSGKSNIQFVGRMNVTFDGKQVNLEATGGYRFPSYTENAAYLHKFYFNAEHLFGVANVGDVYSYGGHNFTIAEINITSGVGNISCTGDFNGNIYSASPGTLTKVSGSGSETLVFSNCGTAGNPFVYNGVIDMQQYADDYCNPQGAAHGRIDVVYTELFGNGTSVYTDDFTTRMSEMQAFITQTRAVFPDCKFCIGLFWNPDLRGGTGANYGANGGWSDPYGIKYSNMNLCNALQKYITDNNLSEYVFILNWLNEFDEWNDMMQTTKPVNVRSTVTEIFGVNGVHPATVGYYQMADTAWRLFVAKFCQS